MNIISTRQGDKFIVDTESVPLMCQYKWHSIYTENNIFAGSFVRCGEKYKVVLMHRLIANCPQGRNVEHINLNYLDNRLSNLRISSPNHRLKMIEKKRIRQELSLKKKMEAEEKKRTKRESRLQENNKKKIARSFFKCPRNIFHGLKQRCNNQKHKDYKYYGGRGIKCDWEYFEDFWKDVGGLYKDGLSIDRINVNGNYCKENCRWILKSEQPKNRRPPSEWDRTSKYWLKNKEI